jgi:predicted small secreted protein
MKRILLLYAVALAVMVLTSCRQDEVAGEDDIQLTGLETEAEEILLDIDALVEEALESRFNPLKSAVAAEGDYLSGCPVMKVDSTAETIILTIDFGESCMGKDGKIRSGKIIVTSSFPVSSKKRVKTFENFSVDGKKVEGIIEKTMTPQWEEHMKTATIAEDVTITFPENKGSIHRKTNLTREYRFYRPAIERDNTVTSWGETEFTRLSGLKITKTIDKDTPLLFRVKCHQIVSGIVSFSTSDNRSWQVDYGDGNCDRRATLTREGKTRTIFLH